MEESLKEKIKKAITGAPSYQIKDAYPTVNERLFELTEKEIVQYWLKNLNNKGNKYFREIGFVRANRFICGTFLEFLHLYWDGDFTIDNSEWFKHKSYKSQKPNLDKKEGQCDYSTFEDCRYISIKFEDEHTIKLNLLLFDKDRWNEDKELMSKYDFTINDKCKCWNFLFENFIKFEVYTDIAKKVIEGLENIEFEEKKKLALNYIKENILC